MIHQAIQHFEPLSIQKALAAEDQVFQSRQEYKFIIPLIFLDQVLTYLKDDFFCKQCDDGYIFRYKNTYFDTSDCALFHMHRQGKYNRIKVRIREYQNGIPNRFIECKEKVRGLKNKKKRQLIGKSDDLPADFLNEALGRYGLSADQLRPAVNICYDRLHFVSKNKTSRVTIDFNLSVYFPETNPKPLIPGYFVLELKSNTYPKAMIRFLRRSLQQREQSFSKYCVALCFLNPLLKRNRWKSVFKYCL